MAVRTGDVDVSRLKLRVLLGGDGGQWPIAVDDARQDARCGGGNVQDHQVGVGRIRREGCRQIRQRLHATRRGADRDYAAEVAVSVARLQAAKRPLTAAALSTPVRDSFCLDDSL